MPQCPLCTLIVQRTVDGTLQDGMREHFRWVHPGEAVPVVEGDP